MLKDLNEKYRMEKYIKILESIETDKLFKKKRIKGNTKVKIIDFEED